MEAIPNCGIRYIFQVFDLPTGCLKFKFRQICWKLVQKPPKKLEIRRLRYMRVLPKIGP